MSILILPKSKIWFYVVNVIIAIILVLMFYIFSLICHQQIMTVLLYFFYCNRRF